MDALTIHMDAPSIVGEQVFTGAKGTRAGDVDVAKGQPDALRGTDTPSIQTDALNASNRAETDVISHGDNLGTYLDAEHIPDETDGVRSRADTSSEHSDMPSIGSDAITPRDTPESVRTGRKKSKSP